jgi:hypothetical protein
MDGMAQVACCPHSTSHGRWAKGDESNNGMHVTADTRVLMLRQGCGAARDARRYVLLLMFRYNVGVCRLSYGQGHIASTFIAMSRMSHPTYTLTAMPYPRNIG